MDRVFFLTPSASSTAVIEDKDNVFQVCFTDPNQGSASAQYIADHKLGTKVAVIYNNADVYSTGIRDTFVAKAAELGLEIVSETTFSSDDNADFSVQVADAQNNGAEILFLPMYYTPASLILKTAADKNYKPIFFGVDGMDGILSVEGFDTSLAEGVMLQRDPDPVRRGRLRRHVHPGRRCRKGRHHLRYARRGMLRQDDRRDPGAEL